MKSINVTKFLPFIIAAIVVITPLTVHAATDFSCSDKSVSSSGTSTGAILTVNQTGTIPFSQIDVVVESSSILVSSGSHQGASAQQMIYLFDNLTPNTSYKVVAIFPNGTSYTQEELPDCAFVSQSIQPAASTPAATATPQVAATAVPTAGQLQTTAVGTSTNQVASLSGTGAIVSPDGDGLIPCDGDDCSVSSVIQLLDNLMAFFFQTLLLPIFVAMVMYLGVSYLTAEGKPGQHAKVISMAKHMIGGLVLILCAWLIVHTILSIVGYNDPFGFFG